MKKYIYGILLVLGLIVFSSLSKANAATLKWQYTFNGNTYFCVLDYNFNSSASYDVVGTLSRPVGVLTSSGFNAYLKNATTYVQYRGAVGSNANNINVGYINNNNNQYGYNLSSNASNIEAPFPVFNNYTDAVNYAKNLSYNASNIVGGSVPVSYSYNSSQDYRTVVDNAAFIFSYQKYKITLPYELLHFETYTDLQAGYGVTFSGNVPSNAMKRIVTFNFSVPTRQSFLDNYGSYFDVNGTGSVLAAQLKNLVGGFVDDPSNNKSRWINNMEYHNLSVSVDVPLTDNSLVFIESLTSANARVRDAISNYYSGAVASAFVVENLFARLHSVEAHLVGYDAAANKYVAYPSGYYLLDQFYYDGTYHKKLGFSINDESSVPNGSSLTEQQFNNIGNESNYPSIPGSINQAISDQLTNDINNTGDNVINNYIDGVNNSWKDFTDGELNVDDQISDVYSILKSISHIGVLFGLLFNGFFPPVVITLIGFAVLLIPIIIIIKLIK